MVTREQIEEALGDNKEAYRTRDVDHTMVALSLLRDKIPYGACVNIIWTARHDIIFLCHIENAMPYLSEQDLDILADCNVMLESNDRFSMFV